MNFIFSHTPLKFFVQDFWRDEAFSFILAKKSVLEILSYTAKDFNPPLYYLLLHFWMGIVGRSEVALRSLSLFFFVLFLYVCVDFMIDVFKFSFKKSLLYTIFFLCNPLLLYYAFEARMYSMFAFFTALSFYSFFTHKKKMYIISTLLGLLTHYFMIFGFLIQIFLVYVEHKDAVMKSIKGKKWHTLLVLFKTYIFIGVIYLPWIVYMLTQKSFGSAIFWIKGLSLFGFLNIPSLLYTGYEPEELNYLTYWQNIIILGLISLVLYFLIAYFVLHRHIYLKQKKLFYALVLWGLFPPVVIAFYSIFQPFFLPRYLIVSAVGLVFLMIFLINTLPTKLKIAIILLLFIPTWIYNSAQIKYREKTPLAAVFKEIKTLAKPGDMVYVTSELDYFTAEYYFGEGNVKIYNRTPEEIPPYVGKVLIPPEKSTAYLPLFPHRAFVLESSGKYSIESSK
jgi:hypothetical protein